MLKLEGAEILKKYHRLSNMINLNKQSDRYSVAMLSLIFHLPCLSTTCKIEARHSNKNEQEA